MSRQLPIFFSKITKYERKIEKLRKENKKNAGRRSRSRTRSRSPLQTRAGPSAPRRIVTEYDKGPEDGTIHEDDAAREDDTGPEDNDDDDVPSDAAPDTEADTEGHIQPQPNPLLLALGLDEPNWHLNGQKPSKMALEKRKRTHAQGILVPENCQLLSPPLLNGEVNAAINEACKNRDKTLANKQKELGLALTALGLAITELLKESPDNIKIMKLLSDTGRILTDLHHGENITRNKSNDPNNTYKASTPTGKLEWSASCIYTVEDDGSRRTTTSSSTIIPTEEACTALSTTSTGTPSGEELPACSGRR
ncbi:hypothetical protein MSG28_014351 [Choristoneura fumiferana]|uniref:Uncharacterized protein n=1 Tax=Choristoneura fumiferana TaxID=7141 RepID=A0ACC0JGW8_CHOFU|nr:hypothetical protein MSG28_014351 [Choristoneura fumiferana]